MTSVRIVIWTREKNVGNAVRFFSLRAGCVVGIKSWKKEETFFSVCCSQLVRYHVVKMNNKPTKGFEKMSTATDAVGEQKENCTKRKSGDVETSNKIRKDASAHRLEKFESDCYEKKGWYYFYTFFIRNFFILWLLMTDLPYSRKLNKAPEKKINANFKNSR